MTQYVVYWIRKQEHPEKRTQHKGYYCTRVTI